MRLYTSDGKPVTLTQPVGSGGEGVVYLVDAHPSIVAKVFHPQRLVPELREKVAAMERDRPVDPTWATRKHHSLAWVDRALYKDTARSAFCGYTMPHVDTSVFKQAHGYFDPADRVRRFGGAYTWRHLMIAAYNLSSVIAAVHAEGHRVGDLRETNVLVAPNSLVALIDCDSFEIHDRATGRVFPTRVGTAEYLPPEMQSMDFKTHHPDRYHADLFATAVLIFKFLMLGVHPYQARGAAVDSLPSTASKIGAGLFPYVTTDGVRPPEFAPPFKILPPSVRDLMIRAFVTGHADPSARPSAREWFDVLGAEGPRLKSCKKNHWYGGHLRRCPWCRSPSDPFPASFTLGSQIAVDEPARAPSAEHRKEHIRSYVKLALSDGPMTEPEKEQIGAIASSVGLRKTHTTRIIAEETQRLLQVKPSAVPSPPPPARTSPDLGDHVARRSASWTLLPFAALGALAGALAPALVPIACVVVVVPAFALWGQIAGQRSRGVGRWRLWMSMPPRIAQTVLQAVYHLVPAALWFALFAGPLIATAFAVPAVQMEVVLRVLGAAGVVWWLLYAGYIANGPHGDPFLTGLDAARVAFEGWSRRSLAGSFAVVYPALIAAVVLGLLVMRGAVIWWPLAGTGIAH